MTQQQLRTLNADQTIKKAFGSDVVGFMVGLLGDYIESNNEHSLEGFKSYYIDKKGTGGLTKAKTILMRAGYSETVSKEYVIKRVFNDTFRGFDMELKAKNFLKEKYNIDTIHSTKQEDLKFSIDLISKDTAYQVKPHTYKIGTNPSLMEDKALHKKQQAAYTQLTGRHVTYIYYKGDNIYIAK